MPRERYSKDVFLSFSKEEKEKKRQYGHERYKNLPQDEKQKLVEYRKKYYKMITIGNYYCKKYLLKKVF